MKLFDLISLSVNTGFSPIIENARTLKAVSMASRALEKPMKRFCKRASDFIRLKPKC